MSDRMTFGKQMWSPGGQRGVVLWRELVAGHKVGLTQKRKP